MLFFGRRKGERRSDKTQSRGTDQRKNTERRSSVPRRKHERNKVKGAVFAQIEGLPGKVGQMIDVSMGGAAFHYIDIGKWPDSSFLLKIFAKSDNFHLDSLYFITITDLEADHELAFSSIPTRRRGGQFADLSPNQISKLEYFLINHTSGIT
jgi:hypothetical protein